MAKFRGTPDNDRLIGTSNDDQFKGRGGDDKIGGKSGNDTAIFNVSNDGADNVNLGGDSDVVNVKSSDANEVRLTFTSAEVGNDDARDAGTLTNQDGGLALRLQAEDDADGLTGSVSRYDDEGITFVADDNLTFDVRDLVSGTERGDQFEVVTLGTEDDDVLNALQGSRPYYINGGAGDDQLSGGRDNDFLVGGAGDDSLFGKAGKDSFIGGGGNDLIRGGEGGDTAIFNVSTDGADNVNLGFASDVVNVSAATQGQVRLTFTSAEVGNDNALDSGTLTNQDGGLALRLQAEDGMDMLTGPVSRYDDEGITFVASEGVTFDVRDLVSGTERGDQFEVVTLGTGNDDSLTALQRSSSYYFNAGMGNDTVAGGTADDFLVGGAGDDTLSGARGDDRFIGGGGNETVRGGGGIDTAIYNFSSDEATIVYGPNKTATVTSADGVDTYQSVEQFQFTDQTVTLPPPDDVTGA